MELLNKLKKDKGFRIKFVFILLIGVMIWASSGEKKEAKNYGDPVCNINVLGLSGTFDCIQANCVVVREREGLVGSEYCKGCVPAGLYAAKEDYENRLSKYPDDICCEGKHSPEMGDISGVPGNQLGIQCLAANTDDPDAIDDVDTKCNSAEKK